MDSYPECTLMSYVIVLVGPPGPAIIDPGDLVAIIIIPSLCLTIGWLVWILTRTKHLQTQARIELHRRLLEKINSPTDLADLLKTDEGRELLEALAMEQTTSLEQILSSVQKGVVLTTVGLGTVCLRLFFPTGFAVFIIVGAFVGIAGLGLLLSSVVAYRLSKSWDLLASRKVQRDRKNASLFG
jgi:TRAP-type mannitol/chloroaromatic compound transport system permease large subunit